MGVKDTSTSGQMCTSGGQPEPFRCGGDGRRARPNRCPLASAGAAPSCALASIEMAILLLQLALD
eukprot:7182388-Prymnesium_polylepis.1